MGTQCMLSLHCVTPLSLSRCTCSERERGAQEVEQLAVYRETMEKKVKTLESSIRPLQRKVHNTTQHATHIHTQPGLLTTTHPP